MTAWLHALRQTESVELMARLVQEKLQHCTLQLWMPDVESEASLYSGDSEGGHSLCNLPVEQGGDALLRTLVAACDGDEGLPALSAMNTGYWPVMLVACRHHQLPVPPGFWIDALSVTPAKDSLAT